MYIYNKDNTFGSPSCLKVPVTWAWSTASLVAACVASVAAPQMLAQILDTQDCSVFMRSGSGEASEV